MGLSSREATLKARLSHPQPARLAGRPRQGPPRWAGFADMEAAAVDEILAVVTAATLTTDLRAATGRRLNTELCAHRAYTRCVIWLPACDDGTMP